VRTRITIGLSLLFAAALPMMAGEYAVLANGFRLRTDGHELQGSVVRLHMQGGVTDLPAESVVAFEAEEYTAPSAPASSGQNRDVVLATPAPVDPKTLVHAAALRSGLPPAFVASVAQVESGFRPDAVSSKGAIGVMQLMPDTARALSADPRNPAQNIDAGTRLLRELLIKYDGNVVKALSAYNAGSGAVDRYRGIPPYAETQDYVNKVIRTYIQAGGK
jgi:soluble lytic murein transglycosylase-like protein